MNAARVGRFTTAAVVCAAALLLGGCSGDSPHDGGDEPTGGPGGAAGGVQLGADLGKVSGRLKPKAAEKVVAQIAPVVDGWFDAAYLSGDYPRKDFTQAFPGFTKGAAHDAKQDAALMTNKEIGADMDSVSAEVKEVDVDLLAAHRKAAGATARFTLVFKTAGSYANQVSVKGQLFLTKGDDGKWRVFGYKVTRSSK
jgi:outer membrane murein-binding lipoprotein Lpp